MSKHKSVKVIQWCVLAVFLAATFFTMYYGDIEITYKHGLLLLDCIREGRFLDFYPIAFERESIAVYAIPIYLIFAVWNVPAWIATRFFEVEMTHPVCLLWAKILPVLFIAGCIYMCVRIADLVMEYDREELIFLCASSLLIYCPVIAVAQYDSIGLFFSLWAVKCYLKAEKWNLKVSVLFAIAFSMKMFALFGALLLILLVEKKIWKILRNLLIMVVPNYLIMLPFSEYGSITGSFQHKMLKTLFSIVIPGPLEGISIFILAFFLLCIIAYFSKGASKERVFELWNWFNAAFWLIFICFVNTHPYWIVLMFPYVVFFISRKNARKGIVYLVESTMEIALIVHMAMTYTWVFLFSGAFAFIFPNDPYWTRGDHFSNINDLIPPVPQAGVTAIFFGCGVVLLVLCNPWRTISIPKYDEKFFSPTTTRFLRIGMIGLYIGLTIVINYF